MFCCQRCLDPAKLRDIIWTTSGGDPVLEDDGEDIGQEGVDDVYDLINDVDDVDELTDVDDMDDMDTMDV